jgi:hypothetical protein
MAYTQADLDRIDRAIARGELEVRYGDRLVRFRSFDELRAAKREIQRGLDAANSVRPRPRASLLRHGGKGV